jgi:hypothetical protein
LINNSCSNNNKEEEEIKESQDKEEESSGIDETEKESLVKSLEGVLAGLLEQLARKLQEQLN